MSPTSRNRAKKPSGLERRRRAFQSGRAGRTSNRELRRQAFYSIRKGAEVFSVLCAVLAQKGGEVVVTKGTIDQVGENLRNLSYKIDDMGNNEFRVQLVEGTDDAAPVSTINDENPLPEYVTKPEDAPDGNQAV